MTKNLYQDTASNTMTGPNIEANILDQAGMKMRIVQKNWKGAESFRDLNEALQFNQKIWHLFQIDVYKNTNDLPKDIRQNLLSISIFIKKLTLQIMAGSDVDKLTTLIQINESLASGLRCRPENSNKTEHVSI